MIFDTSFVVQHRHTLWTSQCLIQVLRPIMTFPLGWVTIYSFIAYTAWNPCFIVSLSVRPCAREHAEINTIWRSTELMTATFDWHFNGLSAREYNQHVIHWHVQGANDSPTLNPFSERTTAILISMAIYSRAAIGLRNLCIFRSWLAIDLWA
jgi:hypothetical protein